jgi:hypothetical protein
MAWVRYCTGLKPFSVVEILSVLYQRMYSYSAAVSAYALRNPNAMPWPGQQPLVHSD